MLNKNYKTWTDFPEVLSKKVWCEIEEVFYDCHDNEIETNTISKYCEHEIGELVYWNGLIKIDDSDMIRTSLWFEQYDCWSGDPKRRIYFTFKTQEEMWEFSELLEKIGI